MTSPFRLLAQGPLESAEFNGLVHERQITERVKQPVASRVWPFMILPRLWLRPTPAPPPRHDVFNCQPGRTPPPPSALVVRNFSSIPSRTIFSRPRVSSR